MSNTPRRKDASSTRKTARPRPPATQEAAAPARNWRRWMLFGLGGVVAVAFILFIISDQPATVDLPNDPNIPEAVETFEVTDRTHLETAVSYEQSPPVGGAHNPVWLNCGFYDEPVPNENAVHALEHGVVWVTYQPDLADEQLDTLKALANESEVIVSPYPGLDSPVVATVWGAQLRLDDANSPDLLAFTAALRNATAPEPGASCLGGVGQPAS